MTIRRFSIIAVVFVSLAAALSSQGASGQETIMITEDPAMTGHDTGSNAGSCGCRNVQQPPWHGNVQGTACGCNPCCDPHTGVFHADPRGQLRMRRYARENCMRMPSSFPRFHTWCTEGYLPSPPPPATPRCHQCGAVIEGGF